MRRNPLSHARGLVLASLLAIVLMAITAPTALAQGSTINGVVGSPNGYPLPTGTVVKLFDSDSELLHGQATPDLATGAFSLGPVANGLYTIKAVPPAGSGLTQSVIKYVSVINGPVNGVQLNLTLPQINGTVTKPDGATPVTATVRVYAGSAILLQVVEAPGGNFQIGGLLPGSYALQARPATDEPFWDSPRQVVVVPGGGQNVTLSLTNAQLWGTVQDSLGNPVPAAAVHVVSANSMGLLHRSDLTSASGYWSIGGLMPGAYLLWAEPPFGRWGLVRSEPQIVRLAEANNPYTLILRSAAKTVSGIVQTNTGMPVANAQVIAHRVDMNGAAETLTGPDGRFQLSLSAGLWAMTVKPTDTSVPANWVFAKPPQLVHFRHNLNEEAKVQDFEVLTADAKFIGVVALPGGGVPGFPVTVVAHNDEGIGRSDTIDAATGAFEINIPNGTYQIAVLPAVGSGYLGPQVDPVTVASNSTADLGTLTLLLLDATIKGTISDGSIGVEGIPMVAWRPGVPGVVKTTSAADGSYQMSVAAGTWHVQPAPGPDPPYLYSGQGQEVTLTAGQTVENVNFTLTAATARIVGSLVDEDGNLVEVDGWAAAISTSDSAIHNGAPINGGFFTIYVPAGTYNVFAHLPAGSDYMSGLEKSVSVSQANVVTVAAGEATITITVRLKDATIAGALWDPRAQAVASGVSGGVAAWGGSNWAAVPIHPGNGAYLMDIAAGLWHLNYHIDPLADYVKLVGGRNVVVQSGQTATVPLPIVPKDGEISGIVLDANGSPLAGATVFAEGASDLIRGVWLRTLSRADGAFSLAVPNGTYRLGATVVGTDDIRPLIRSVVVPPNGQSVGNILQFQEPNAIISGTLAIATPGLDGMAFVWAWSDGGGFVRSIFPISNSAGPYTMNVISNDTWHIGAIFETATQYWGGRAVVTLGPTDTNYTQDIALLGPYAKCAPVVVTFDASEPQRIELADGTSIYIPAGAMPVTGNVTLRVVPLAALPYQQHANVYKYGYAFLATDGDGNPITEHFDQDVIIAFRYSDAELLALGIPEWALVPAYYSTTTDQWTFPDSYVVDPDLNLVTMQIDHFTDFALTAGSPTSVYLPIIVRR